MKNFVTYSYLLELMPLLFCIYFRNKISTKYLKVFFVYLILLALSAIFALFNVHIFKSPLVEKIIVYTYILFECTLFTLFFYHIFKFKIAKIILFAFSIPNLIFYIIKFIEFDKFNSQYIIFEFIFFTGVILYYFAQKLNNVTQVSFFKTISFWLSVGLFFYFMGNLSVFIFSNSSKDPAFIKQIRLIFLGVLFIKDTILSLAWFAKEPIETDADIIVIPKGLKIDYDPTYTPTANDTNP